ncbi:hypothetical protein JCM33374_g1096 [Metschnikowia sp. JCM 33374]|nr:hypothetical protein JCM33374_g1096 [Metschnikowia sp. JCM 33374]
MEKSSLDKLAHIANMSHDFHHREPPVKMERNIPPHIIEPRAVGRSADANQGTPTLAQANANAQAQANAKTNVHSQAQAQAQVQAQAQAQAQAHAQAQAQAKAHQIKMKKMACTCCRQQKSKCDAHERHPLPCTQCAKKNLVCEVNANFRRKGKRAHLARIEREFLELKRSFQDPNASEDFHRTAPHLAAYVDSGSLSPSMTPVPTGSPAPPHQPLDPLLAHPSPLDIPRASPLSMPRALPHQTPPANIKAVFSSPKVIEIPESALQCEEKSVDAISLSPQMIRELYMEYVRHYHPILPVVDVSKGPERIHRLCPALFWVMMFVALRRFDDDKSLLLSLSPLVKNILAEISISPITRYNPTEDEEPILNACSVYSVQAFILYSLWPPLTSSLSADSSWNTIGVALFQAIRIGLHSSGQLFGNENARRPSSQQYAMAQEQMKTWILCNIVSENIATAFGFPAFVQFDFLSAQHCDIPVSTRHIMEIAHFEDQVAKTLTLGTNTETGLTHINERIALVKVLLTQLDDLEIKLVSESNHEDGHRKLHYLVARIHLLTCYFLDAQNIPSFELSKGLVRLFNAAVALMSHVDMCEAKSKDFVKYLPVVSILHIWQASCIIVKLANSPLKRVIDVDHAKQIYSAAIRLVGKASVLKHDISYRASGIMRNMWQLFRSLDEKNLSHLHLKTKSRMTASVFFDCLSLLRDKVGMAKLNIKTDLREPNGLGNGDEDDDANSFDDSDDQGAVASSEDEAGPNAGPGSEHPTTAGESQKTTPGSSGSSARVRKMRRLSGVQDAESKARKIIRTIPLDPQPIAATNRSTIFKVVNPSTNSSPSFSTKTDDSRGQTSPASVNEGPATMVSPPVPSQLSSTNPMAIAATEHSSLRGPLVEQYSISDTSTNLESNLFDMNNDMLWKDVDSLMNDFGFHP